MSVARYVLQAVPPPEGLLTMREVAALARVSLRTVERAVADGELASVVVGKRSRRVNRFDAERWMGLRLGLPTPIHREDNR